MELMKRKTKITLIIILILTMLITLCMGIKYVVIAYGNPDNPNVNFAKSEAGVNIALNMGSNRQNARISIKAIINGSQVANLNNYSVWLNGGNALTTVKETGETRNLIMTSNNNNIRLGSQINSSFGIRLTMDSNDANNDTYDKNNYVRQAGAQFVINYDVPAGYIFQSVKNDSPFATFAGLNENWEAGYVWGTGGTPLWTYQTAAENYVYQNEEDSVTVGGNGVSAKIEVKADLQRLTER